MVGSSSIRRRLATQALLIGAVMLCLAAAILWSQREADRAIQRIVNQELRPAAALRQMESRLLAVHARMQSVLLSQSSPLGALELLARERVLIADSWAAFRRDHRNWLEDPAEAALIADIEAELPALADFFDQLEPAYRIYDPVQLTVLVDAGWYQLQGGLIYNLRSLASLQEEHAIVATRRLEGSIERARWLVGILLFSGLAFLVVFSVRLARHILRRIVQIEEMLESVADGREPVLPEIDPGESEIRRIATAISGTLARLTADRNAIASLMHQQQTILESAAEGIYGLDADGRITFMNPAGLAMLGYTEAEVVGQSSHALLHHHYPDGRPYPLDDCPIAASRCGGEVFRRDDEVFFRKDGSAFAVEYTSAPLADLEQHIGGVVIFHDISARRTQERLLKETVEQLRTTNEQLAETQLQLVWAEKLAGLGQLAAGIAHEINNPVGFVRSNFTSLESYVNELITIIDGYQALLRETGDAGAIAAADRLRVASDVDFLRGDVQALLGETREGLERVIHIVADLRDFSRVDAKTDGGQVDLVHALESTLAIVAPTLDRRIEIIRDFQASPRIRGDAARLNQVFLNVLVNAAKAIDGCGTITVRTACENDEAIVDIVDSGCGMSEEVRARMFDPFYTTRPVGQGTGLGLSLAYSVVRSHGGCIEVDSALGAGTTIRLRLPVAAAARACP